MIHQIHQQEWNAQPCKNQQRLEEKLMAEQLRRLVIEDLGRENQPQRVCKVDAQRFRP